MNIIFWGTPDFCIPTLEKLIASEHNILAVVTKPDKRRTRGNSLCFSPVKELALKYSLPVITPKNISTDIEMQNKIKSFTLNMFCIFQGYI